MRVLIVPDSFKGTLTAFEVADAIAGGWGDSRPTHTLDVFPMSDGGEGFGLVMAGLLGAVSMTTATVDADHRPRTVTWWRSGDEAVIESAEVVGLAALGPGDPRARDTYGLAAVLRDAAGAGVTRLTVGLGGSSTNDGGFGLARGLGWRFRDGHGREIERWVDLGRLAAVEPGPQLPVAVTAAVDVVNPLLGPEGCTRVFGPQKGLTDLDHAEGCLSRLAAVVAGFADLPGAGAAGGLGFGLAAFAGATLRSGFEVFAAAARLGERISGSDLVITGEGSLDAQSLMGKGVGEVARLARERGVPCLALAGQVHEGVEGWFAAVHALEQRRHAAAALRLLAGRVAAEWTGRKSPGRDRV